MEKSAVSAVKSQYLEDKSGLACCSKSCASLSASEGNGTIGTITKDADLPNNNHFHLNQQILKEYRFPKRKPVDLEFRNIKYTVREYSIMKLKRTSKEILHGVDGHFKSGELTAIMGPSGAGKSTLLNILAGLTTTGVSGTVLVNGRLRGRNAPQRFQRLSRYIQQDDELRSYLTAGEAMVVAAHLKLGYTLTDEEKHNQVRETLAMLGLEECYNTLTGKLSGGQRKRLAIALELLSNPPVLFLDEPTTGLDSLSCSQCVSLLKRLSQEGRTVVCTIHQPSALLFDMFDKLYALASGYCIYKGPAKNLLPFLGSQGMTCPPFHNPADFLIEVAIGEHNVDLSKLAAAAAKADEENKSLIIRDNHIQSNSIENGVMDSDNNLKSSQSTVKDNSISDCSVDDSGIIEQIYPPASQFRQTWLLLKRNFLSTSRSYQLMLWRLSAHIAIGLIFGYLYHGVGRNAEKVLANYVYLYGSLLLMVYTGKMSVTLQFPLEMEKLKREHFNRWYNLGPYMFSVLALEIPFQIICCASYIGISYIMTGNPLAEYRMGYFFLIATLTSLCAQAWGYFVGATTPVKIAVFIGPVIAVLFSIFGFCIRFADTPIIFQWMFHASYFRAGFHSLVYSVYGMARDKLDCFGDGLKYCHYIVPEKFLREMDIIDINIWGNLSFVFGLGIFMHLATLGALWCRLNRR